MLLPLILLPFLATALAKTYNLQHRHSGQGGFTSYGTIDIPESESDGIIRIEKTSGTLGDVGTEGWYQVQLSTEGQGSIMSSTKSCYLNSGPVTLVVHNSPRGISSIDLIPDSSTPTDGSCPTSSHIRGGDTIKREVVLKTPHLVYGPDLSPPAPPNPVGTDGKPIPPPEEKSFLQKYWLPLLGVGFFVISQMAPDDKPKPAAAS